MLFEILDLAFDFALAGFEADVLVRAAWPRLAGLVRWSAVAVVGYAGVAGEIFGARVLRRRADRDLAAALRRLA